MKFFIFLIFNINESSLVKLFFSSKSRSHSLSVSFKTFLPELPINKIIFLNLLKLRFTKSNYKVSDFQKSERDFAFVIDKSLKVGLLEKLIKSVDENIIQKVTTFDVYEGDNIPKDKKSVAINVMLQALDKTLSEKDLDQVSQKIIETVRDKTGATIRS